MEAWNRSTYLKRPLVGKHYPGRHDPPSSCQRRPFELHSSASDVVETSTSSDVPSTLLTGNEKVGVLLLNLGGPETLDDVQPFLFNLFADPVTPNASSRASSIFNILAVVLVHEDIFLVINGMSMYPSIFLSS